MAHTVLWPKKKFFYPIGNTPPVSFTSDLDINQTQASILLLGSGDPRSILYTVYTEATARNVLLLTMILDGDDMEFKGTIWNVFFHLFLDKTSLDRLQDQCKKLVDLSISLDSWEKGGYSELLRFCSASTLAELRRLWIMYLSTKDAPNAENNLRKKFRAGMEAVRTRFSGHSIMTSHRSAGPVWAYVTKAGIQRYEEFWKTGVTFSDAQQISASTFANPIFAYDSSGQTFNVHYGTDPTLAFHLAALSAKLPASQKQNFSASQLVEVVKEQFKDLCSAFKRRINRGTSDVIIRLCVGDALAFSKALYIYSSTGSTISGFYASAWEATQLSLNNQEYSGRQRNRAPVKFHVIDTSNLADHLGLVNVLVTCLPLLHDHPTATLFTNTLLAPSEVGGGFEHRACANIATLSLVLGIVPVSYVSGFSTQTNTHETLAFGDLSIPRQETISWKHAPVAAMSQSLQIPAQALGNILYGIYLEMFLDENLSRIFSLKQKKGFVHYTRASFAVLLAVVKRRVDSDWKQAFGYLVSLIEADKILLTSLNHYQDLCCQLHIHGVYTVGAIFDKTFGNFAVHIFNSWERIPPVVCVVLKVPRQHLRAMEGLDVDKVGTPILQCEILNLPHHNIFSAMQFFFGTVVASTSDPHCLVATEDLARWQGNSDLIVSFYVPSWVLTVQSPETQVILSVRPGSTLNPILYPVLGPLLQIYSANLLDEKHVFVARRRPSNTQELLKLRGFANPSSGKVKMPSQLVTMLTNREKATGLTGRLEVNEPDLQAVFRACPLSEIKVKQASPFSMVISFGRTHKKILSFPYAIDGRNAKTRVARKSLYIEVDVGLRGPDFDGLIENPFPMSQHSTSLVPWNIQRINLGKSPDLTGTLPLPWLQAHLALTWSDVEHLANNKLPESEMGLLSNIKGTINGIFTSANQSKMHEQLFLLCGGEGPPGILFFLNCFRLDLPSHTLVADACVIAIAKHCPDRDTIWRRMHRKMASLGTFHASSRELEAWWQLLPVLAERCRDWSHLPTCKFSTADIPDAPDMGTSPLCDCGRGKSIPPSFIASEFGDMAPLVTRVALGPLFPLSYVESVGGLLREWLDKKATQNQASSDKCDVCGQVDRLMRCSVCSQAKYCSKECQKKDWKAHKAGCKQATSKSF
ncbi:hypothetical protein H0H92_005164 [Tricholoma furcatifolium]|nr:hypothetical protein H0H92_005164 [Tricholoma furcatifolium]